MTVLTPGVVDAMTDFPVTVLLESSEEITLSIRAARPGEALDRAVEATGGVSGIYSVWDPEDPMGMPVFEQVVGD